MIFAIKAEIRDPGAEIFSFSDQRTMYDGKHITPGDVVFIFASENQGGKGLIAKGFVISAEAIEKKPGIKRQTPLVNITVKRSALARGRLGRNELQLFTNWDDGRAETELNFKFYRQPTNKVVGISDNASEFLNLYF